MADEIFTIKKLTAKYRRKSSLLKQPFQSVIAAADDEFGAGARRSRRFNIRTQQRTRIFHRLSYTRAVKRHKCRAPLAMESPKPICCAPPKNLGLLELIRTKREWDWKPSIEDIKKGFHGWHQRGYLPHFDAPGVTQFITFQLHDSFPVTR